MEDLFRQEVRQARAEDWMGGIRMRSPRIGMICSLIAASFLLMLLGVATMGSYTQKEKAVGRVVPSRGLLSVPAPVKGSVSSLSVTEGLHVRAGDVLMLISSPQHVSEETSSSVGEVVARELEGQRRQLESELISISKEQDIRLRDLSRQSVSLRNQMVLSESRLRMRQLQAERARETFSRIKPLEKSQLVTALQFQQYEAEALEKEGLKQAAAQDLAALKGELDSIQTSIASLPIEMGTRRTEVEHRLSELNQSALRNKATQAVALTATSAGQVAGLAVDAGQAVKEGQKVLSLIPDGSEMQAELWVSSRAIGAARLGGAVTLRFAGFPYQTYGVQRGRIESIGETPLDPAEIQARSGILVNEPSYLVMVSFGQLHQSIDGRKIEPRSGMSIDADLLLERRRILDMFTGAAENYMAYVDG